MTGAEQTTAAMPLDRAAIAAAFAWWEDAGVDLDFADQAAAWLAAPDAAVAEAVTRATAPARPAPPPAPQRPRIGGDPANWPQRLEDFSAWWLGEPSLDPAAGAPRIPPRGVAGAEVMVLVDHPEGNDSERLLSGPQGAMVGQVLRALGLGESQSYIASALPRHMPLPDWAALTAEGLGAVIAHHVRLAAPQRVLVFGNNVSSLLGHDPANSNGFLPDIHHEGRRIPALVAPGLDALAARPRGKARLWQALLDWTAPVGSGN